MLSCLPHAGSLDTRDRQDIVTAGPACTLAAAHASESSMLRHVIPNFALLTALHTQHGFGRLKCFPASTAATELGHSLPCHGRPSSTRSWGPPPTAAAAHSSQQLVQEAAPAGSSRRHPRHYWADRCWVHHWRDPANRPAAADAARDAVRHRPLGCQHHRHLQVPTGAHRALQPWRRHLQAREHPHRVPL